MFDSFQLESRHDGSRRPSMTRSRQKSTGSNSLTYACTECRRRKCRCDGAQPCQRCKDARKGSLCTYVAPKQRVVPSQKAFDELWASHQQYQAILERLFPSYDSGKLNTLSRRELVRLASRTVSPVDESPGSAHTSHSNVIPVSDASLALDRRLHEADARNEFDEGAADFVADDVNALSLNSKRYSSYLGSASVAAAFRVIAVLSPHVREFSSKAGGSSPGDAKAPATDGDTSKEAELEYMNAYFSYVHPIIPMLDEASFRLNFFSGSRTDSPWLALLNVVLALGSIAALTSADDVHWIYYGRAKTHLGLEALGTGRLESLQALGLMGGYYLHYCQQPNMAFAVTGAAIRVASALGLHRQQEESVVNGTFLEQDNDYNANARTWWGLFCLDTWGSTTMGRPSFDWSGPSITVQPICWGSEKQLNNTLLPFAGSLQFCKIAAEVQDRLSYCSILDFEEVRGFDARLENWFQSLPLPLRSPNPCPKKLLTPRAILKWRYQNLRLLLYRPVLLLAAICQKSRQDISDRREIDAIEKCRTVASETIVDIASERVPDQISGWNATWFLFQASLIPLVSVFWEKDDVVNTGKWQSQLEMVLQLLNHMTIWSPVAQKCYEVLNSIYQISLEDRERDRQGHNSMSLESQELEALRSTFPSELAEQVWDSESWDRILEFGLENSNFLFDPMPIV